MLLELMAPAKCFPGPGHSGSLLGSEGLLCAEPGGLWQVFVSTGVDAWGAEWGQVAGRLLWRASGSSGHPDLMLECFILVRAGVPWASDVQACHEKMSNDCGVGS